MNVKVKPVWIVVMLLVLIDTDKGWSARRTSSSRDVVVVNIPLTLYAPPHSSNLLDRVNQKVSYRFTKSFHRNSAVSKFAVKIIKE